MQEGYSVEYWDISNIFFSQKNNLINEENPIVTEIFDLTQIEYLLERSSCKQTVFMVLTPYEWKTIGLYTLLLKYRCFTASIYWGALPITGIAKSRDYLFRLLKNPLSSTLKYLKKNYTDFLKERNLVKKIDLLFVAGNEKNYGELTAKRIIPINLIDYENFIFSKNGVNINNKISYILFLDSWIIGHPDIELNDFGYINSSHYMEVLNKFFDMTELKFNSKVLIAAHPKAVYAPETFGGRKIFYGQTPELAKSAYFIIAHHSTAISYAVLAYKPVIFIYTETMKLSYKNTIYKYIENFSIYMGSKLLNISRLKGSEDIFFDPIDEKKYNDYRYDFLTSLGSENTRNSETIISEIKKINNEFFK
jgi:hypothetical protein